MKIAILLAALFALSAQAESEGIDTLQTTTELEDIQTQGTGAPTGAWMFFEGSVGHLDYDVNSAEMLEGSQNSLGLGLNYFTPSQKWVHHILLGAQEVANNRGEEDFNRLKFDLGTGYRLGSGWQVGPTMTALTKAKDLTGSSAEIASFGGLQVAKDFDAWNQIIRVGAKSVVDFNISSTTASISSVFLQFGFGGREAGSAITQSAPVSEPETFVEMDEDELDLITDELELSEESDEAMKYKVSEVSKGVYKISIDQADSINFDIASSSLEEKAKADLAELGKKLASSEGLVSSVVVEGHTDSSGSVNLNKNLSLMRAQGAKEALSQGGFAAEQIKTLAKASNEPVAQQRAEANRRVEVLIQSDATAEEIEEVLNQ